MEMKVKTTPVEDRERDLQSLKALRNGEYRADVRLELERQIDVMMSLISYEKWLIENTTTQHNTPPHPTTRHDTA